MNIEQRNPGAVPDLKDERDFVASNSFSASVVDWSKEFRHPDPGSEDQGSSDSCVAQAWSYYHRQLKGKDYSRRDLFSRIALEYGAYIRDGGKEIVGNGQATRDEVKDPKPQTMQNMRDKSGTNQSFREDDKEFSYFVLQDQTIDGVAAGIRDYKGVVFGVTGSNPGWAHMLEPRPPYQGEATWGHALYGMGYHLHNGVKCIIAKSSWCDSVPEHHIKQNYFQALNGTFNAWVLIPKGKPMNDHAKIINYKGTVFIAIGAKDIPQLVALGEAFGKPVQVNDKNEVTNADIVIQ